LFSDSLLVILVEDEGAVGGETEVKVFVLDLCDARVVVVGDLDAL
jgi:hypothetical protein